MSATNPTAPEPSEIAGRFQVVQKLGAGAFGTVYKARDKVLGRMLAIKTIRMEGLAASQAGLAEMLDRFKREAQVAAQLKHPGIVTIYDIGESEGLSYISMELIDGVGLDRVISESGRLPVERAAALAAQVAEALDFAHRHGVVHRDIKPANIMIEPGDRVKVTDFGIAKPTDSAEHLTVTGSLLGTPSYMSPEQARGATLDGRSDVFSLGCVIYEMIAGRKAFRGESITALLFKIITEEPQPLRELDPSTPDTIVHIIAKAIAKAPETRYQTARELGADLLALTRPGAMPTIRSVDAPTAPLASPGAEPTVVSQPTAQVTQSSAPTLARDATPPAQAAAAAPTVVAAAPTAAGRSAPVRRSGSAAATPAGSPRKTNGLVIALVVGVVALLGLGVAGVGTWVYLSRRNPPPASLASAESAEAPPATAETPAATTAPTPVGETAPAEAPAQADAPRTSASDTTASGTGVGSAFGTSPTSAAPSGPAQRPSQPAPRQEPAASARVAPDGSTSSGAAPAQDYSFLDEVPEEGPDGRAQGEALAQKYRTGGSASGPTTRFARRSRFPRNLAPPERPAVATLAHLLYAEEAYHRAHGRYGTLEDLRTAGLLRIDVSFHEGVFQRARYRFQLSGGGGEFRATATPLAMGGRPFVVDDSGFVRVDD